MALYINGRIPSGEGSITSGDIVYNASLPAEFAVLLKCERSLTTEAIYDNIAGTLTSNINETLIVDGIAAGSLTFSVGSDVLLDIQSSKFQNGIYVLSQAGDGSNPWILTRHPKFNAASNIINQTLVTVLGGLRFGGRRYRLFFTGTFVLGTTLLSWLLINGTNTRQFISFPDSPKYLGVDYASTAHLDATYDDSNILSIKLTANSVGTFAIDGSTPPIGTYVLVRAQTSTAHNGIYILTATGGPAALWTLVRPASYAQETEINPTDLVYCRSGTLFANTLWILEGNTPLTDIGTDPITYIQFTGGGGLTSVTESFVPTLGQTIFTLAATPSVGNTIQFLVNGIAYTITSDFTVAGTTVTWLNTLFTLETDDVVSIIYFV